MKTKEFKYKIMKMGYTVSETKKNKGLKYHKLLVSHSAYEHPVGWVFVNRPNSMRLLDGDKELFEVLAEYAATPLEEREEEKKYIYRLPVGVHNADGWLIKTFDTDQPVQVTTSSPGYASRTPSFHFTDKEVARYPEDVQALFNICVKEGVE